MTIKLLLCAFFAGSIAALCQTINPSQITPRVVPPTAPQSSEPVVVGSSGGLVAPAGSDKLSFHVTDITVDDGFSEMDDATHSLASQIAGKVVTVEQLYAWANQVEAAYGRAGFLLARVTIPPQALEANGAFHIRIVDGFIEKVDTSRLPERLRTPAERATRDLVLHRRLRLKQIERDLLLLSDIPNINLVSFLEKGDEANGTVLVLSASPTPLSVVSGLDNRLPMSIGQMEWTNTIALSNFFGAGEQFFYSGDWSYLSSYSSGATNPFAVQSAGFSLPIGMKGVQLSSSYTRSTTNAPGSFFFPSSAGRYDRAVLEVEDTWLRSRQFTLSSNLAAEYVHQSNGFPDFAERLSLDKYGLLRGGAHWRRPTPSNDLQFGVQVTRGILGRSAENALLSGVPLSQIGASPRFTKLNLNAAWMQDLPKNWRLIVNTLGQTTFNHPVFISEQISLDGPTGLSAFHAGTLTLDSGVALRTEIEHNFSRRLFNSSLILSPYLYDAIGEGRIYQPTVVQARNTDVGSAGIGLHANVARSNILHNIYFTAEYGKHFSNIAELNRGYGLIGSVQFTLFPHFSEK